MYYIGGKIKSVLPNKLEVDGKIIFNPKWHHFETAGWKKLPVELESVERQFIKWIDGDPFEMTQEEKDLLLESYIEKRKKQMIDQLWQSATAYEQKFISGSAPTKMLQLALQGNEKAAAIGVWLEQLWGTYYTRRDLVVAAETQEDINIISEDFSSVGEIPFTVKETIFGA